MAKRRRSFASYPRETESEDVRPHGSVLFADPSTNTMTAKATPFNHPESRGVVGPAGHGIRGTDARHLAFHDPLWDEKHPRDDDD